MKQLFLFFCSLFICSNTLAQVPQKVIRERKEIVRKLSKNNPIIRINEKECTDVNEFIFCPDSFSSVIFLKPSKMDRDDHAPKLIVMTKSYALRKDSLDRQYGIREHRIKEMNFFFGSDEPLILYGDKKITRKEFYNLPENEVAFVNYYVSDFVKSYYASIGAKNGIVYVCPRQIPSTIRYHWQLPMPANGRNYLLKEVGNEPFYDKHDGSVSQGLYIGKMVPLYYNAIEDETKATVVVSCKVDTEGKISPLFVERISYCNAAGLRQKDKLIDIALEIINSMPAWSPGFDWLFDPTINDYVSCLRESSISLEIPFRKTRK